MFPKLHYVTVERHLEAAGVLSKSLKVTPLIKHDTLGAEASAGSDRPYR